MSELLAGLKAVLGDDGVILGSAMGEVAYSPWSRLGEPLALLRPRTTAEVAAILKLAQAHGQAVVPWGGRTGLVGGAYAEGALALSLERMNRIETVDAAGATMTVQAGCTLQAAAEAAQAAGLFLPLDLGARGSATLGGNISTNAGGNRVLRWGMMRDMVLGLEAVLADGTVVSAMNSLIKNNAGYDLKPLFIGTEGTLGVVTRAVLRLRPAPVSQVTAFVALDGFAPIGGLLRRLERDLGGTLSAFEVMWSDFYDLVTSPPAAGRPPLERGRPFYALVESMGGDEAHDQARLEQTLAAALEDGQIVDAVIAKSGAERAAMWALRDDVAQTWRNAPIFTFDVSLKLPDMEAYVEGVRAGLEAGWPGAVSLMVFGHLGDGNLHLIIGVKDGSAAARTVVERLVYGPLQAIGGSISAEHGIGLEKRDYLSLTRTSEEIALMRTLKRALDPKGVLNPGKIFEVEGERA